MDDSILFRISFMHQPSAGATTIVGKGELHPFVEAVMQFLARESEGTDGG
jgi:hypothetical protein